MSTPAPAAHLLPVKRTLLDRLVAHYSPALGVARALDRIRLAALDGMQASLSGVHTGGGGGYHTTNGSDAWHRRWSTAPRSAEADTLSQLPSQRGQSRDLVRNHAIAASAIGTNVNRAVGTGLALSAQPHAGVLRWSVQQAMAWRERTHAEFSLFADSTDCDFYGNLNFYGLQELVLRGVLESGDDFTLLPDAPAPTPHMPYRLRLQVLEADRVGNPAGVLDTALVSGGVRRSAAGPVDAYHVYDRHPGQLLTRGASLQQGQWISALGPSGRRRALHHWLMLRPEQPRGVPYLAPVMGLFSLLGTYTDAEVKAAVVSAFVSLVIETPGGTGTAPVWGVADPLAGQTPAAGQPTPGGPAGNEIAVGPGAVIGLAPGEKANTFNPMRPNPAFGAFVQAVIDQLGAGLLIGPEMLMHKYSTSYTAARAAFLDAWKHLLGMRTLIARSLCQPVYETWMAEAVAIGRISAPGFFRDPLLRWAYTRAEWHGDSQGSLNPKDEVAAYREAVDGRLLTRERAQWELFGTDWHSTYPQQVAEHQQLLRDGMLPAPKAGAPAPPDPRPLADAQRDARNGTGPGSDDDNDSDASAAAHTARPPAPRAPQRGQ